MNDFISHDFHDSLLLKIELKEKVALLTFQLVDSRRVIVVLTNLERMLCNSFKEGNIVIEASIVNHIAAQKNFLKKLFELTQEEMLNPPSYIEDIQDRISKKNLSIFHIAPSYGCEMIALCESVKIKQA